MNITRNITLLHILLLVSYSTSFYASIPTQPDPISAALFCALLSHSKIINICIKANGPLMYSGQEGTGYTKTLKNLVTKKGKSIIIKPGTILLPISAKDPKVERDNDALYDDISTYSHPYLDDSFPKCLPLTILDHPDEDLFLLHIKNPKTAKVSTVFAQCKQYDEYDATKTTAYTFDQTLAVLKQRFAQEPKYMPQDEKLLIERGIITKNPNYKTKEYLCNLHPYLKYSDQELTPELEQLVNEPPYVHGPHGFVLRD